jgi:hypothetical protein
LSATLPFTIIITTTMSSHNAQPIVESNIDEQVGDSEAQAAAIAPLIRNQRHAVDIDTHEQAMSLNTTSLARSFSVVQFNQLADGLGLDSFVQCPQSLLAWDRVWLEPSTVPLPLSLSLTHHCSSTSLTAQVADLGRDLSP